MTPGAPRSTLVTVGPQRADVLDMLNNVYMLRSYTDPQWQGSPAPVEDYEAVGFRRQGAQHWRCLWIPPHMARDYSQLGLSPSEAVNWGVIPALVEAYRDAYVNEGAVGEWVRRGIMPHEVRILNKGGYGAASLWFPSPEDRGLGNGGEDLEEAYGKWSDAFDQSFEPYWHDPDWHDPEEPCDPDESYLDLEDPRHPHSPYDPYDPYDPDKVVDPYEADDSYVPYNEDEPQHPYDPQAGSVGSGSVSNVIPLFRPRGYEDISF